MTGEATDTSAYEPTVGEIIAETVTKALFVVLVPWWRLDRDAPLSVRLWRWRYVYLVFTVSTLLATWEGILTDTLLPTWMAIGPHLVGLLLLARVYAGGTVDGVGLPLVDVPDVWILGGVVTVGWLAVLVQTLRYKVPLPGIPPVTYRQDDEEFVLPVSTSRTSQDAPHLPRLDQAVSTLVLGETGSGKTSALKLLAYQLPYGDDTAVIAHDFGREYQEFYRDLGFEVLRISVEGSDVAWNLFEDVEKERDFRELAGAVFGDPQGSDPFHRPAKQVFEAILTYLYREGGEGHRERPSHADLVSFLTLDRATIQRRLEAYDDLSGAAAQLDSDTGKFAPNVYQTLQEHVDAVFVGDFTADGSFSLREYVEDPRGRVLIVDSAPAEMETVGPMFRLLLDWAIRHAMATDASVNFVLDEIDQLPALSNLSTLTARGRNERSRALIGVQTLGQLTHQYGSRVDGVIGNCPQGIYFSGGDPETTEYIQAEQGRERQHVDSTTVRKGSGGHRSASRSKTISEQDRYPVPSATLKQLGTGECVVKGREHWWLGRIAHLDDVEHRLAADPREAVTTSDRSMLDSETGGDPAFEPGTSSAEASDWDTSTGEDSVPGPSPDPEVTERAPPGVTDDHEAGDDLHRRDGPATGPRRTDQSPGDETQIGRGDDSSRIDSDTYPTDLRTEDQWLTWKPTDDGRKVPRAPWASRWPDEYVSAQNPDVWTSFTHAREATENYDDHELAFTIRDRDEFPSETVVLVDYDAVRDPETGDLHPTVRDHLDRAWSYADVSTSGTGVHILCRGALPEGVKSGDAPLSDDPDFPDAGIEVYDSARFVAMTGDHLAGTPTRTTECHDFIEDLAEEFATVTEGTPDELIEVPTTPREELADVETTDDVQDVFDAIQHVRPEEIRLRSTVTEERSDGSKSLDPAWASSESGTRLAQVDDGWIYRKGMHGLDAMQVVALEERIIQRPDQYPEGKDFWKTLQALRERGAHIPKYEPRETEADESGSPGTQDPGAEHTDGDEQSSGIGSTGGTGP